MKIPFLNLRQVNEPFEKEFKQAYNDFMRSGWYVLGERVMTFETEFASYCDSTFDAPGFNAERHVLH